MLKGLNFCVADKPTESEKPEPCGRAKTELCKMMYFLLYVVDGLLCLQSSDASRYFCQVTVNAVRHTIN